MSMAKMATVAFFMTLTCVANDGAWAADKNAAMAGGDSFVGVWQYRDEESATFPGSPNGLLKILRLALINTSL